MTRIPHELLWAWFVYDQLEPSGEERADLRASQIAREVRDIPFRMGFLKDEPSARPRVQDFMFPSWEERVERERIEKERRDGNGNAPVAKTFSRSEWESFKDSQRMWHAPG